MDPSISQDRPDFIQDRKHAGNGMIQFSFFNPQNKKAGRTGRFQQDMTESFRRRAGPE
jgi:hypothetical protein